ncbi:hypothetical protein KCP73_08845 [Salmonella enterica subsp. enterica]|nr:hypothetical protein KCP73_08845 [Salmonella enterica subsp. enterica]
MSFTHDGYGTVGAIHLITLNVMSLPLRSHFSLPVIHLQKSGVIIHDVNTFQPQPEALMLENIVRIISSPTFQAGLIINAEIECGHAACRNVLPAMIKQVLQYTASCQEQRTLHRSPPKADAYTPDAFVPRHRC